MRSLSPSRRHSDPLHEDSKTSKSKVVYVSNLPRDYEISEAILREELIKFGRRFGEVEKVLLMMNKSSGLLQFADVEDSLLCVRHVQENNCFLSGRKMRAEFSNKPEIISHRSQTLVARDEPLEEDRNFHSSNRHQPPHREEIWTGPGEGVTLNASDLLDLPPGSRIVNMPVRIDADGTMTPLFTSNMRRSELPPPPSYRLAHTNRDRSRSPPPMHSHYSNAQPPMAGRFAPAPAKVGDPTLLTCFNLPTTFTVDEIAVFFGVYGDIMRVKKSTRNDRQCWVQFRTPGGAQNVLRFLNNIQIFGRDLSIEYSNVQRLRVGPDPEKDKSFDAGHHRYQTRDADFYRKHLCPPTRVLFTSNIPLDLSEDELCSILSAQRVEYLRDSVRPKTKSGFVHFESVNEAAHSLIENHRKLLSGSEAPISLSFSQRVGRHNKNSRGQSNFA